jgi:hypothetical protein
MVGRQPPSPFELSPRHLWDGLQLSFSWSQSSWWTTPRSPGRDTRVRPTIHSIPFPAWWAAPVACAAVQGEVHTLGELPRGSSYGGLEPAVDRFGMDAVALLQPRSHPAPLIDASQEVDRLRQAYRDLS